MFQDYFLPPGPNVTITTTPAIVTTPTIAAANTASNNNTLIIAVCAGGGGLLVMLIVVAVVVRRRRHRRGTRGLQHTWHVSKAENRTPPSKPHQVFDAESSDFSVTSDMEDMSSRTISLREYQAQLSAFV